MTELNTIQRSQCFRKARYTLFFSENINACKSYSFISKNTGVDCISNFQCSSATYHSVSLQKSSTSFSGLLQDLRMHHEQHQCPGCSRCKLELTCTLLFQPWLLNLFCINHFTISYKHIPAKEKRVWSSQCSRHFFRKWPGTYFHDYIISCRSHQEVNEMEDKTWDLPSHTRWQN